MKNKKKFIRYIVIIFVLLLVFVIVGKNQGWIGKASEILVSTDFVVKKTITETVSANGKIQPEIEVKISPDVSGEIVELYVKEGDHVKKGDLLAKINPDFYLSNLDRMTAAVNTSKANLATSKASLTQINAQYENSQATYYRNEKLYKQGVLSESEWEAAKAAYAVALANVEGTKETVKAAEYTVISALASLKEAKDNLSKTSVFAPASGTISKLNVEKGERVVGTSQFAGTEMMRIADLKEMEVNVSVNENDIVRVKMGDTALIEVDSYLKRKFKGVVTEIANSATSSITATAVDQVTNFDVKIRILRSSYADLISGNDSSTSPFRPGMSATVDIQTKTVKNVVAVPIQSVTVREDTTGIAEIKKWENTDEPVNVSAGKSVPEENTIQEFVFVYKNGIVSKRIVTTGIQDNTYIEIISGLKENDEVISAPYKAISKTLKDGDKVKKVDKKDLFAVEE